MGKRKNIISNAKPLETETNLFEPPPAVKAKKVTEPYLVALSWKPRPEKMAQLRGQFGKRVDVDEELAKCLAWHHRTNTKRKDWERTFLDWLKRATGELSERQVQAMRDRRSGFKRPNVQPIEAAYNPSTLRSDVL